MTKDQIKLLKYFENKKDNDSCESTKLFPKMIPSDVCTEICPIRRLCINTGFAEWNKRQPEIKRLLQTISIEATPGEY